MKFLLIIIILNLPSFNAHSKCANGEVFVARVIDGDTIETEDGKKIRILGLDTYDTNKRMAQKQSARTGYSTKRIKELSKEGTEFSKNVLLQKCVKLIGDYKDKGYYKRLLRYVEIDGKDYQKMVLEKNLGNVYCGDKKIKRFDYYNSISKFQC